MRPYKISNELKEHLYKIMCYNNGIYIKNGFSHPNEIHKSYLEVEKECIKWGNLNNDLKNTDYYATNIYMFKDVYLIFSDKGNLLFYNYDEKNRWKWWFMLK